MNREDKDKIIENLHAEKAQFMRESEFYKTLTPYLASAYAEGFCEGEGATLDEKLIAWQYISDTGLWRSLQGWYGRTVENLLVNGLIEPPKTKA